MSVWSAFSAEYGSAGYGSESCSWSAEKGSKGFSLSPFAPNNLVSRDELGRPVPRQSAHSPPHSGWIGYCCMDTIFTLNIVRILGHVDSSCTSSIHFTCSADHNQDWQPYPVDPYTAISDYWTYIQPYPCSVDK